jgi:hypothetical protein
LEELVARTPVQQAQAAIKIIAIEKREECERDEIAIEIR